MLEKRALDLERADPVRTRRDHVVGAADEPKIAVIVELRAVARDVPLAAVRSVRLFFILIVAAEERRRIAAQADVADVPGLARLTLGIHDADVVSGRRLAHRAGPDFHPRPVSDQQRVFGLPVAVEDRQPERVFPARQYFGIERLAGGDAMAQLRNLPALAEPFELRFDAILRRRLAQNGHLEIANQVHALRRIEGSFV